jgi:hypothetical protein
MDINNTQPGDFVEYAFPESGYPQQISVAQEHLMPYQRYEVAAIDIKKWHTDIYLVGFEVPFNSCLFSNVNDYTGFKLKEE